MVLFEHVLAKPLSLLSVKRSRWIHAKHFRPIYIRESPKHDVLVHLCLLLIEESHNLIALPFRSLYWSIFKVFFSLGGIKDLKVAFTAR